MTTYNPPMDALLEARQKVARLCSDHLDVSRQGTWPIPLVPFIAKDRLSTEVLEFYLRRLRETRDQRPIPEDADAIIHQVGALLGDFHAWQAAHPAQVKLPD